LNALEKDAEELKFQIRDKGEAHSKLEVQIKEKIKLLDEISSSKQQEQEQ